MQYSQYRLENSYDFMYGYANQRETKLFEFSVDTNMQELKIKSDVALPMVIWLLKQLHFTNKRYIFTYKDTSSFVLVFDSPVHRCL